MSITKPKITELLSHIKIARVVSLKKHENADKLQIVQIDAGAEFPDQIKNEDGTIQIVTAATNITEGDLVPYLSIGHVVPGWLFLKGEEITLESRPMRGEISHGMILAEDEIGLSDEHEGIMIISNDELGISNKGELVGKSLTEVLTDEQIETICKRAGIIEVAPEIQSKIDLITRDLQEYVGEQHMAEILNQRALKVYWGTAPTGRPSIGYFVPMIKIADFLKAGCDVTILLANIHAFLDNMKSTWELLEYRSQYYKLITTEILRSLGAPLEKLRFIEGTEYQLDPKYTMDMYKIATLTTIQSVKGAGAEVVKQVESPILGGMLYPILQALDEEYLGVDAQLGGVDQRKIFMFAREYLPKIGYKKRIHLMNPLIPGLGKSGKMSSSEPHSKIDFDDSDQIIQDKISKAFSEDKKVDGNGLLALVKYIIFRKMETESPQRNFEIKRPEKWGGDITYSSYEDLEKDFVKGNLSSIDIKAAIIPELISLISPIREVINKNQELVAKAYPEK